jgi:EpsI family protein
MSNLVEGAIPSRRRMLWLPVCLILVLQIAASRVLSITERSVPPPRLADLPVRLGAWEQNGSQSLGDDVQEYLQPDEYILRNYMNRDSGAVTNLFVAYFRSSQGTHGPHSPRVCLPGAGWLVRWSATGSMAVPGRAESVPINEYVMEKSGNRIQVVYWYQSDRAVWADEFQAKLRLLPDLIRYQRSDISLVRLISPVPSTPGRIDFGDGLQFAKVIFPLLAKQFATSSPGELGA